MNKIVLAGKIVEKPILSHSCMGEDFYKVKIASTRKSGTVDVLPCIVPETLVNEFNSDKIRLSGEIRTRNYQDANGNNHLEVFVFVNGTYEYEQDENYVELYGATCQKAIYRETPLGREISEVIVASNRERNGKSDYIPCIFWGRKALRVAEMEVGTEISITGRLQSREYVKQNLFGECETKTAYELSVVKLKGAEEC